LSQIEPSPICGAYTKKKDITHQLQKDVTTAVVFDNRSKENSQGLYKHGKEFDHQNHGFRCCSITGALYPHLSFFSFFSLGQTCFSVLHGVNLNHFTLLG